MKRVAIVEYGMGNLDSVARAVEECGGTPVMTNEARGLAAASYIVLPGVGAFARGIGNIRERGLDEGLYKHVIEQGVPFLGICLGMQLLATKGWEGEETNGLGWIEGEVKRLEPLNRNERIPHVGWNEVVFTQVSPLFDGISSSKDFYFVHSYHFSCRKEHEVLSRTPYCGSFVSAVGRNHIFGVQFHPEKSRRPGLQVIKNFLTM